MVARPSEAQAAHHTTSPSTARLTRFPPPAAPSQAVHAGLLAGRKLIWEEAARRIGVLLSSPAAFEGEHFLQVLPARSCEGEAATGRKRQAAASSERALGLLLSARVCLRRASPAPRLP